MVTLDIPMQWNIWIVLSKFLPFLSLFELSDLKKTKVFFKAYALLSKALPNFGTPPHNNWNINPFPPILVARTQSPLLLDQSDLSDFNKCGLF